MLNIDYSTRRKFLMSCGMTFMFLGVLLFLILSAFFIERTDNFLDTIDKKIEKCDSNDTFMGVFESTLRGVKVFYVVSLNLIFLGLLLFIAGLFLWIFRKEK